MNSNLLPLAVCLAIAWQTIGFGTSYVQGDWPQFRGNNSSGIGTGSPPVEFEPGKNQLWMRKLPPGHSSPCIHGNRIFLTSFDAKRQAVSVVCLERSKGEILWQQDIDVDVLETGHPSFNPASSSPTCDDRRIVAYFGSYGLICFDHDGQKLWEFKLPLARSFGGNATSPAIFGDRVILYRGSYVDHFLLAVDKRTGKELWRVPQEEPFTPEMACTSCPIMADGKLIIHSARSVQAFDPSDGKQVWELKCATTGTSTPVVVDDKVVVAAWNKMGEPSLRPEFPTFQQLVAKHDQNGDGAINRKEFPKLWIFHRPDGMEAPMNGATIRFERTDSNKDQSISADEWKRQIDGIEKYRANYETHGLLAIGIKNQGSLAVDQVRTLATQSIPEVPSPISDGHYIYFVKNGGVLTCLDPKTNRRVYRKRTGGLGTHYASPVYADGKLFCTAGNGKITVVATGDHSKVLAINDMNDPVFATPAIVDGTIYVRTHSALFAFKKAKDRQVR